MKSISKYTLLLISTFMISSCGLPNPQERAQILKTAKNKIILRPNKAIDTKFTSIGTTAFNNNSQKIKNPRISFTKILTTKLKHKGYNVIESKTDNSGAVMDFNVLEAYDSYTGGVGFHQRKFLGKHRNLVAHCNVQAYIADPKISGKFIYGAAYLEDSIFSDTSVSRNVNSYYNLSGSEKSSIDSQLRNLIIKRVNNMIIEMGL